MDKWPSLTLFLRTHDGASPERLWMWKSTAQPATLSIGTPRNVAVLRVL